MGRSIHSLSGLPSPLSLIDERFMDIPPGTDLCMENRLFKLLFFVEADHDLFLEGRPAIPVRGGDLLIQPLPIRQTYRATRQKAASRIHVMRILLDLPLPRPGPRRGPKPSPPGGRDSLASLCARHFTDVAHLPRFLTPAIRQQMTRIREEIEARRPGYRFEAANLASSLVIETIRRLTPEQGPLPGPPPGKAELAAARVKEYLVENLALPLTLDQIAWHVRLSREHLARMFRQATGQTVFAHLGRLRLEAAKTHLCNPNLQVAEVARRAGFSSVPLFCRTFKRATRLTPLEYRARRLGEIRFSPSRYASPRPVIRADL